MHDGQQRLGARALKRGGARNRKGRTTHNLTERQCRNLIAASADAWAAGMPFNRYVTIAWGKCGIDPADSVAATGEWITLAREWARECGQPMPWAWVQEWGPVFHAHCHVLFWMPPDLAPLMRTKLAVWARKVVKDRGGSYVRGTTQTQVIFGSRATERWPDTYRAALLGKVHYMLKCAPAELEASLCMLRHGPKPWGQSCRVIGKRIAIWQSWKDARVLAADVELPVRFLTAIGR